MKHLGLRSWIVLLSLLATTGRAGMTLDSLYGPVTQTELASFKTFMQGRTPPATNTYDNTIADGTAGMEAEALGLVYEISTDRGLLDIMIKYCDAFLALRNDTNSGSVMWDGARDPVWLTKPPTNSDGSVNSQAGYAGCENNDIAGHIAYCARLILQTPALWSTVVSIGDPNGYGATYLQRAQTYLARMDYTQDAYMLKWFIDPATSRLTAPASNAWTVLDENVNAWNRQMMFLNGFQRLSECHQLLGDAPARVARYDAIIVAATSWFTSSLQPYTTNGHPVYNWTYGPTSGGSEDNTLHSTYDIWGMTRAYASGRYGVAHDIMVPFANTFLYVMYLGSNQISYYVNGSGSARSFVYPGWMPVANFGPATYPIISAINSSRLSGTAIYDAMTLWVKNARYLGVYPTNAAGADFSLVTPWMQRIVPGASNSVSVTVNSLNGFNGDVSLGLSGLPGGATASFNPARVTNGSRSATLTLAAASSTPAGTYRLTVNGTNAAQVRSFPVTLVVATAPNFTLTANPSTLAVAAGGSVTSAVTLVTYNGFTNSVSLSASGLPSGVTASFAPSTLSVSGVSTLTLTAAATATTGTSTVNLSGTASNSTQTTILALTVNSVVGALPDPWSDIDIGAPTNTGSATFSDGVFAVSGSGSDIYSASDQFHFVSQPVTGDFTLSARVLSLQSVNAWSKSGVMVRESTNANAKYLGLYMTASNGVDMQFRAGSGSNAVDMARAGGLTAPYWVRLARAGNIFSGYRSPDGTNWTQVGTNLTAITMAANAVAGLAVCSHDSTLLNHSTFDNITLVTPDFTLWAAPDSQTVATGSNTTLTVTISGTNGFSGKVALGATLPAGMAAGFNPATITGSGTSILSVTLSTNITPDDYTLTLTGTSGSLERSYTVNLSVPADFDGDGIPDAWMYRYFGHPFGQAADKSRATDDADGDGMSNLEEYLAGTDPTNAASNLRITFVSVENGSLRLAWTVVGGKSYVVQTATALGSAADFSDASPAIAAAGSGESVTNYLDTGALTNASGQYYRIRLGP
jgi:regulation of enolase protein 1 (concanavalin A-like superfamily)